MTEPCAYYNEHDPFAAAWLRELIRADLIAFGVVDERDIRDVPPEELYGYTQCHFFAGIGVWSHALRQAGWPDDRPVWTGSCPCQPFSASGKRGGFADERHLWPAWFHLIRVCRPECVFGEQVASKDGLAWFDLVSSDLEGEGYAVGAADTCAAGFGAPHIRQRLYFVADTQHTERRAVNLHPEHGRDGQNSRRTEAHSLTGTCGEVCDGPTGELGHARSNRSAAGIPEPGQGKGGNAGISNDAGHQLLGQSEIAREGIAGRTVGDTALDGSGPFDRERRPGDGQQESHRGPSLTNGFWHPAQWLWCRDGKYRPVEPEIFPLATGITNRVGLLRGAGNALCAPQAQAFIKSYLEIMV